MRQKSRRPPRIWRERGPAVGGQKALGYLRIEIDNLLYRFQQNEPSLVMNEDSDTRVLLDTCLSAMSRPRIRSTETLRSGPGWARRVTSSSNVTSAIAASRAPAG